MQDIYFSETAFEPIRAILVRMNVEIFKFGANALLVAADEYRNELLRSDRSF